MPRALPRGRFGEASGTSPGSGRSEFLRRRARRGPAIGPEQRFIAWHTSRSPLARAMLPRGVMTFGIGDDRRSSVPGLGIVRACAINGGCVLLAAGLLGQVVRGDTFTADAAVTRANGQ